MGLLNIIRRMHLRLNLSIREIARRTGLSRNTVAALTIALFLLHLRRAGERAGRLVERLSTSENTYDIQRQMLDAASHRPADRDALADRLRVGRF